MDYLGPSRVHARASNNPWPALTAAERKKLADAGPECKRVVGCLERVAPVLEGAAHRILQDDWRANMWRRAQAFTTLFLLLVILGGMGLVYRVATAGTVPAAVRDVYDALAGSGSSPALHQSFPLIHTPTVHDPGAPSWAAPA